MADQIILNLEEACAKHFENHKLNCSGFARAVAKELGHDLPDGNADSIMDNLQKNNWERIADGVTAERLAAKGIFIIVGLKSKDHAKKGTNYGHVAVVIKGVPLEGKYPYVWCGSKGGTPSKGKLAVRGTWRRDDAPKVQYYAPPGTLAKLKAEKEGKDTPINGGTLK